MLIDGENDSLRNFSALVVSVVMKVTQVKLIGQRIK